MCVPLIGRLFDNSIVLRWRVRVSHGWPRFSWNGLAYLLGMNAERLTAIGLEPVLTTCELAEYLGVQVQAIYDLRAHGRGPSGIRVGREIRFRVSDVLGWLEGLHEPSLSGALEGAS